MTAQLPTRIVRGVARRLRGLLPELAVVAATVAVTGAALAQGAPAGTSLAAVICYPPGPDHVTRCDDGSYEYVDDRGHVVHKDAVGTVLWDLPPTTHRY